MRNSTKRTKKEENLGFNILKKQSEKIAFSNLIDE